MYTAQPNYHRMGGLILDSRPNRVWHLVRRSNSVKRLLLLRHRILNRRHPFSSNSVSAWHIEAARSHPRMWPSYSYTNSSLSFRFAYSTCALIPPARHTNRYKDARHNSLRSLHRNLLDHTITNKMDPTPRSKFNHRCNIRLLVISGSSAFLSFRFPSPHIFLTTPLSVPRRWLSWACTVHLQSLAYSFYFTLVEISSTFH